MKRDRKTGECARPKERAAINRDGEESDRAASERAKELSIENPTDSDRALAIERESRRERERCSDRDGKRESMMLAVRVDQPSCSALPSSRFKAEPQRKRQLSEI